MRDLRVFCADIGSVKAENFGWAALDGCGNAQQGGTDICELAESIVEHLASGRPAAVGFECPLFVPFRPKPIALTSARKGEGKRPWSAAAGAGVLATGIVEVHWILNEVRRGLSKNTEVFTNWQRFVTHRIGHEPCLFLWEAFVSGIDKPRAVEDPHIADARAAAQAFVDALPDPMQANAVEEDRVISLLGMALLRTGWAKDKEVLSDSCLVLKPR